MSPVFHFNQAITREPARSVVKGLRAIDRGDPSLDALRREFTLYVDALRQAGVEVEVLPPLDAFPDSIFVEDTALVFSEGAILLRPGAPSRRGESAAIAPTLRRWFSNVLEVTEGSVDGGDVLVTSREVMIGLSVRTNEAGARHLSALLRDIGRHPRIVMTPPDVLHFKTDCSVLDDETVLSTGRLAASGVFDGYRLLITPPHEDAAANALRVNGRVLVGDRFPGTTEILMREGYHVAPLPGAQIALLDAGFSCLSLRWTRED